MCQHVSLRSQRYRFEVTPLFWLRLKYNYENNELHNVFVYRSLLVVETKKVLSVLDFYES